MPNLSQHFEQNIEQALQLHLSPRVIAMLRIFQLSYTDLVSEVEKAAEENPMVEIDRPDVLAEYLRYLGSDRKLRKQIDFAEYPGMENLKDVSRDLTSHLMEQLKLENLDEASYKIGELLIGRLEPSGYMKDYEKVKAETVDKLKVKDSQVDEILKIIQAFEPEGVGARDLKECLLIQIKEYNFENIELEELLEQIVSKHLEELGQKNYKAIAQSMGITEDGAVEAANFIRSNLNPHPAAAFADEAKHVVPSFVMEDDKLVNLEEKYGPKIKISVEYERMLKNKTTDAETVKYLKEKYEKAKELIENLERRGETLLKIMNIITDKQKGFLEKGAVLLEPLMQKDLAGMLGVHPSTISRAIAEKYIQTARGLFPVKYLCPRELSGFTPARIKTMILDLTANEDKRHPLTDDDLKGRLLQEGVKIERRTIAAYRKELGILSYSERVAL